MLTIAPETLAVLQADRPRHAIQPVVETMLRVHPAWRFGVDRRDLEAMANRWIDHTRQFGIEAIGGICRLYELEQRWGGFADAESAWLLDVLRGPLDEQAKLDYVDAALHGH